MLLHGGGDLEAAQHARQLMEALLSLEHMGLERGGLCRGVLADLQVPAGKGGHLGQMRDADHLPVGGESRQQQADHLGRGPADTHVHLVEDHGGRIIGGNAAVDSQAQAGKLATRGHLGEWFGWLTRIHGGQDDDGIPAAGRHLAALGHWALYLELDHSPWHTQALGDHGDLLGETLGTFLTAGAEIGGRLVVGHLGFCQFFLASGKLQVMILRGSLLAPQIGKHRMQLAGRYIMAAGQFGKGEASFFQGLQARRIEVEVALQVAHRAQRIAKRFRNGFQLGNGPGQLPGQRQDVAQLVQGPGQQGAGIGFLVFCEGKACAQRLDDLFLGAQGAAELF